jgi:hypothetical protein
MTPEEKLLIVTESILDEALAQPTFRPLVSIYEDEDNYRCEACLSRYTQPAERYGDHAICPDCSQEGDVLERISRTLEKELDEACAALAAERN